MFIRRTQTRNTVSGETYHTHRLVRSVRVDGKVKQLTATTDVQAVDVDSLEWVRPRTVGVDHRAHGGPGLGVVVTNTYFEGEMASNPKAQRGHSKEKRSDFPLVTLGLVLDGSGFVRRSEVFAGNVSEGQTLAGMLEGLNAPPGALVVMDRGIATEANLFWLREQGYRYLVVSRERSRQFAPEHATTLINASGECLHLEKMLTEDATEVKLYGYSERRADKENGIQ